MMRRMLALSAFLSSAGAVLIVLAVLFGQEIPDLEIAFVLERDGSHGIYGLDARRGITQRLAKDGFDPAWSPDGKRLAFEAFEGNREIYVMNADGSDVHNVSRDRADDYAPIWSPDSRLLFFVSERDGVANRAIYVVDADGGSPMRDTEIGYLPAWSPDGRRMAVVSGSPHPMLLIMDASSQQVLQQFPLTGLPPPMSVVWLPNGNQLAFRIASGSESLIYIMNADSGRITGVIGPLIMDAMPVWSPDSELMAFSIRGRNIYTLDAASGDLRDLTQGGEYTLNFSPVWSPDGAWLAFISYRSGAQPGIYLMDREGSRLRRLAIYPSSVAALAWRPG
jgi:TolB protein